MKLLINKEEIRDLINNCKNPREIKEIDNIIDGTLRELITIRDICNEREEVILKDFLKSKLKDDDLLYLRHKCKENDDCKDCEVSKKCSIVADICGGFNHFPFVWSEDDITNREL